MGAIKVLRAVLGVILCVLLGMSLWLTVQRQVFHKEELELLGVVVSPVTEDTMAPALEAGDLAVAVSGGDCSLGDAVLCQDGSFQRLVGSVDGEFIARGDSQSQEDEALLPAEQIRGRVTGVVPGGQGVWAFFGSLWGLPGMLVGVPLFAVIYDLLERMVRTGLVKRGHTGVLEDYQSRFPEEPEKEKPAGKSRLELLLKKITGGRK